MAKNPYIDGTKTIPYGEDSQFVYAWYDDVAEYDDFEVEDRLTWTLSGSNVRDGLLGLSIDGSMYYTGESSVTLGKHWCCWVQNYNTEETAKTATLRVSGGRHGSASNITVRAQPWTINEVTKVTVTLPASIYSVGERLTGTASVDVGAPFSTDYNWSVIGGNVICTIYSSSEKSCSFYIDGNNPSLASNTTITITARYGSKSGTGTMTMKPSLTGVQILSAPTVLNIDNNFSGTINVRPLPVGTGAPITYSAVSSNANIMTVGAASAKGDGTYNIPVYGVYNYYGGGLNARVTAALTPNPSLNFTSTTPDMTVRPNLQPYTGSFRRGQPYVWNGGSWREAVELYEWNGSSWRPSRVR